MPFPIKPSVPSSTTNSGLLGSGQTTQSASGSGISSSQASGVMYPTSYQPREKKGCGCGCLFSGCLTLLVVIGVAAGVLVWYASSHFEQFLNLVTVEATTEQVVAPPQINLKQVAELGNRLKQFVERGGTLSLTESEINALVVSGQFIKGEQGENPLAQSTVTLSDDSILFGLKIPIGPISGKERLLRAVVGVRPRVEGGRLRFEFTDVVFKGFKLPDSILDSFSKNGEGIEVLSEEVLKNIPLEFTAVKIESKTLVLSAKPLG